MVQNERKQIKAIKIWEHVDATKCILRKWSANSIQAIMLLPHDALLYDKYHSLDNN